MRVDVQLNDDVLALLSGYNRSTSMGIKKPGELQRELLLDMENIEEKREAKVTPEEQGTKQGEDADTVEPKEVASASGDKEEEVKSAPVRVRSDFLSMLSAMAQPNTHEDKDSEWEGEDPGILPEEDESVLPDDEDEDVSTLPEDEDEEDVGILPEDEDEEDGSVLPDDDEDVSTLPADDDEYTEDAGILPADDEDTEGESVASEESTTGILEQQEDEDDGYSSELPEDDDDEEYSSELPADEEDSSELPSDEEDYPELPEDGEEYSSELPSDEEDEEDSSVLPDDDEDEYSVLPADEDDEEDASVLPDDEDEESSVLPEDNEEVEDEPAPAGIQETTQTTPNVVEHPVSPSPKVQKSVHHAANQPTAHPAGYSAPSVPLYDFILNNGGSMLIEDVKKYYPIDEVKKALNLGKIYRFGNKVGV